MGRSPWYALAGEADRIWSALRKREAKFIRVIADGQCVAVNYDARAPHDILRLASVGLQHHPRVISLEVIGVKPNYTGEANTVRIVKFDAQERTQV